jgi:hypothetical protein
MAVNAPSFTHCPIKIISSSSDAPSLEKKSAIGTSAWPNAALTRLLIVALAIKYWRDANQRNSQG